MGHQHAVTEEMDDQAMRHFFALMDARTEGNVVGVLSDVNAWLRRNPAHRVAWARIQRANRLLVAYLKATEPGASKQQIYAFFGAIAEERARSQEEFIDADHLT